MISKTTQEYKLIEQVINNYVIGANGNVELLKIAYHKDAIINSQPIQKLFDFVGYNGKTNATGRIDSVDITGRAASAIINTYSYIEVSGIKYALSRSKRAKFCFFA